MRLGCTSHLAFLDSCVVCLLKVLQALCFCRRRGRRRRRLLARLPCRPLVAGTSAALPAVETEAHPPAMAIEASPIGTSDIDPAATLSDTEGVVSAAVPARLAQLRLLTSVGHT